MASSRKKQDEKNLKTLRELGALPQNKFCFDCNQRGPTYVNVTIGSFVCTKCSGMLRGLTPPHRVKSISMATFTTEEIDILRNRGNDYCRRVWLGLYEGTPPNSSDEQGIRDFMIDKYERKRYYLDSGMVKTEMPNVRPLNQPISDSKPLKINGQHGTNNSHLTNGFTSSNIVLMNGTTVIPQSSHRSRPDVRNHCTNSNNFVADFEKADIFSSAGSGCNNGQTQHTQQQNGFANFDNNPVFNSSNANTTNDEEADDLKFFGFNLTASAPIFEQELDFSPRNNNNWWSIPPPTTLPAWTTAHQNNIKNNNNVLNGINKQQIAAPVEDKYAALKDLDNEMKSQQVSQQQDWSSSGSSAGSLYSSPTPTGSAYSSPSPQGSIFGSPSQGQFLSAFSTTTHENTTIRNPFNNGSVNWGATNGVNGIPVPSQQSNFVNPFREQQSKTNGMNGLSNGVFHPVFTSQQTMPVNGLTNGWPGNPFKVGGVTSSNPNNPFL